MSKSDNVLSGLTWILRDGTKTNDIEVVAKLLEKEGEGYPIVKQSSLPSGYFVSTIWLGLCLPIQMPPMIYETMVFDSTGEPIDRARYEDEQAAKEGHEEICKKYSNVEDQKG